MRVCVEVAAVMRVCIEVADVMRVCVLKWLP